MEQAECMHLVDVMVNRDRECEKVFKRSIVVG